MSQLGEGSIGEVTAPSPMSYGYPPQCTPLTVGPAFLHPFHLGESLQGRTALAWRGFQDSTVNHGQEQPRDPSAGTFSQEVAGTSDRCASDRSETRRTEDVLPRLVCEEITRATFGMWYWMISLPLEV